MFLRRSDYERLLVDLATERGKRETLDRQVATHTQMQGFLCARVNQLEKERAILFKQITNLDIPIPELAATAVSPIHKVTDLNQASSVLSAMDMFADIGDDEARKQGIEWDKNGGIVHREPAETR